MRCDIATSKAFYGQAFGWIFTDYGLAYCELASGKIKSRFDASFPVVIGGPLVVLCDDDLEVIYDRVEVAGGVIVKHIFYFLGGQRFQFTDSRSILVGSMVRAQLNLIQV